MHILNKLEGKPDDSVILDDDKDKQEEGASTDIGAHGRLYRTVLLSHGHVVSLSLLIKRGAFKKPCNGLSNKPLMQKVKLQHFCIICKTIIYTEGELMYLHLAI